MKIERYKSNIPKLKKKLKNTKREKMKISKRIYARNKRNNLREIKNGKDGNGII